VHWFSYKVKLTRLHEDGDISDLSFSNFFIAVRKFLVGTTGYLFQWCACYLA